MNVEEIETEQNGGLSIQNRELQSDGDDISQLDASFQDERQPRVSYSVSSIENKTQEKVIITKRLTSKLIVVTNDSLFIFVPSNPDTIRDIPLPLLLSPVKRPYP
jgi:hypothetical protein